ncbi:hypothetical protein QTJ16_000726 [Diplocarpon rosae]|uniref:Dienelactone hydrolase domain-containing protein n=1 Tax=Diplocarpon rosae TaxID=946125 RepID=A0AAD9T677_9HELO|nr:hypothetical protein QTJ16_000726 [Diplocarpon rosae]
MLIQESHEDVGTRADGNEGSMRIFLFHPSIPNYPNARFPGVVLFSEIYQVTGPVARFARQIAGQGYIVAAPSSYHEFTGPEALAYDGPGTDAGNEWKVKKVPYVSQALISKHEAHEILTTTQTLAGYDEDATLSIDLLLSLKTCNGRVGTTGMVRCYPNYHHPLLEAVSGDLFKTKYRPRNMLLNSCNDPRAPNPFPRSKTDPGFFLQCLGGHLAYRCALDPRISAAVTYFATDLHSATLGLGQKDDSLARAGEIKAELAMIHGTLDNHVPAAGRDLIRATLRERGVLFSWYEVAGAQHAFIRDELSKGRYDPAITKICFEILLELFGRTLKLDLGAHDGVEQEIEDIC